MNLFMAQEDYLIVILVHIIIVMGLRCITLKQLLVKSQVGPILSVHHTLVLIRMDGLMQIHTKLMVVMFKVCLADNDRKTEVDAVIKMEVGPPQVAYRRDLQTALRCCSGD